VFKDSNVDQQGSTSNNKEKLRKGGTLGLIVLAFMGCPLCVVWLTLTMIGKGSVVERREHANQKIPAHANAGE